MTPQEFDQYLNDLLEGTRLMLASKATEYATETDRFHNFKVAAAIDDETPERAAWGMAKKHLVSIIDILDGTDEGQTYNKLYLREKFGDMLNYLILIEAMLSERSYKDGPDYNKA